MARKLSLEIILSLTTVALCVMGYPNGAPSQQCANMFPAGHGVSAQPGSTSPYILRLDRQTFSCPGDIIKVTVSASSPTRVFRGFLCQPRPSSEVARTTGSFDKALNDLVPKQNNCGQIAALTHVNNATKSAIAFAWKPQTIESVYIICTIVEELHTFWVKLSSPRISYAAGTCPSNTTGSVGSKTSTSVTIPTPRMPTTNTPSNPVLKTTSKSTTGSSPKNPRGSGHRPHLISGLFVIVTLLIVLLTDAMIL